MKFRGKGFSFSKFLKRAENGNQIGGKCFVDLNFSCLFGLTHVLRGMSKFRTSAGIWHVGGP